MTRRNAEQADTAIQEWNRMFERYLGIFSAMLLAVLFSACGTGRGVRKDAPSKASVSKDRAAQTKNAAADKLDTTSVNTRRRLAYFYAEAAKQQSLGNYDAAYTLLLHCRNIDPKAAEVHYALSNFDAQVNSKEMSVADIRRAAELQPDNTTYLWQLAGAYWEGKDYKNAIKTFEKVYAKTPDNTDVLDILFRLYMETTDYDNMIYTVDRMELADGESEKTVMSKLFVYSKQGKNKEAYRTLKNFVDKYPNDPHYQVMMANWLLRNKDTKNALAILQKVLKDDPDNASAQLSMVDYYRAEDLDSIANLMEENLLLNTKTEAETRASILKNVISRNEQQGADSTKVLVLFSKILSKNPKDVDMLQYHAAYVQMKNMSQDSIVAAYNAILAVEPDNKMARLQLIRTLWGNATPAELISICAPGVEYNPDEMAFYYFLGFAYVQNDEDNKALDILRKGVAQATDSSEPAFVSDMYSYIGDLLHQQGNFEEAYAAYDSCLQWKDDNAGCLNNYAYYITQSGGDLAKAERMSYKTVNAEPTNSTYLDTYAWVLFCEKRYTEAAIYIEQALANDTAKSYVLLDHAGDIYIMCGETDKAIDAWRKALDAGGDAMAIQRKIKLKKYIPSEQ